MHKHQQKWSYKPYPSNQGCPVEFGGQFAISVVPSDACSTEGSQETGAPGGDVQLEAQDEEPSMFLEDFVKPKGKMHVAALEKGPLCFLIIKGDMQALLTRHVGEKRLKG